MEEAQEIADNLADWATKQMPEKLSESQKSGLGYRLYLAQRWDDAYKLYEELAKNTNDSNDYVLYRGMQGCAAARLGKREEAREISEELKVIELSYLYGMNTYNRACILSILEEKQEAVDLLQQAIREGLPFGIYIIQEQDFLLLKDFPPFQEFIKPKG
jgi:tetratricopeptide (TPR) repeat protein